MHWGSNRKAKAWLELRLIEIRESSATPLVLKADPSLASIQTEAPSSTNYPMSLTVISILIVLT